MKYRWSKLRPSITGFWNKTNTLCLNNYNSQRYTHTTNAYLCIAWITVLNRSLLVSVYPWYTIGLFCDPSQQSISRQRHPFTRALEKLNKIYCHSGSLKMYTLVSKYSRNLLWFSSKCINEPITRTSCCVGMNTLSFLSSVSMVTWNKYVPTTVPAPWRWCRYSAVNYESCKFYLSLMI